MSTNPADPSPTDPTLAAPPGRPAAGTPPPGDAQFDLLDELARGGMGVVYVAHDRRFGRKVAVKTLHERLRGDRDTVDRFVAEARFTGRLQHPGIPPVHDLGTLPDGRPYLAMKLVSGRTLSKILAEREGPAAAPGPLLTVFRQVCQAVGYAHEQGLIHRDLKPSNVMVGAFGEVQVMDWGIAKDLRSAGAPAVVSSPIRSLGLKEVRTPYAPSADPTAVSTPIPALGLQETAAPTSPPGPATDPDATAVRPPPGTLVTGAHTPEPTAAGTVLGTPPYMAPEQARGEAVDARADVFGLGAILCEILTGRPAFVDQTAMGCLIQAATADLSGAWERLSTCAADPDLVALCRRCLAPLPADRPADGGAVADAVAAYQAGVEGRLRAAEQEAVRAAERRKRQRVQVALAAVVGLLLLVGGVLGWLFDSSRRRTELAEAEARNSKLDAELQAEQAASRARVEAAARDAEAAALLDAAEVALRASDARRAAERLDQAAALEAKGVAPAHRDRRDRLRKALLLLREIDDAADVRWQVQEGKFQKARAAALLRAALGKLGITLGETSPAEAARLARESVLGERLLAELNWWVLVSGEEPAVKAALRQILSEHDPDAFRERVRAALAREGWAAANAALRSDDMAAQPGWFVAAVGAVPELDPVEQRAALEVVIARAPDAFPALMSLGRLDKPDRAASAAARARCCQAALALRPDNAAAWYNFGAALRDGGDNARAAAAFGKATALDPTYTNAHISAGDVLLQLGKPGEAIKAYGRAVEVDPSDPLTHVRLARVQGLAAEAAHAAGRLAEADRLLLAADRGLATADAAFKAQPDAPRPWRLYGEIWLRRAELGHADLAAVMATAAFGPGAAAAIAVNAAGAADRLATYRKATAEAATAFERAVATDSDRAAALYGLGLVREVQGDWQAAADAYRRAIQADPNTDVRRRLALALQQLGRHDEARAELREVVRAVPGSAADRFRLYRAMRSAPGWDEAFHHLRCAAELAPQNAEYRRELDAVTRLLRDKKLIE